ncbi:MAG: ribulose-phosphate 3-epimerase [Bacteroidetes bacterium]|jgi:ribulose-phosphate 3-epimerase|nr:ribulose-phosphate 3-epimerase [Chitinophagia bacterium]NBV36780.1 ribulose-phosphate 3-epimerase [Bacteroidota bacterium]
MPGMIAPSILSADFGKLYDEIEMINQSEADWFHVDVMDGVFVPNISFGFPVMKPLQAKAKKTLDVHLMIVDPDRYTKTFADAGAHILTVHVEACTHLHRTLTNIRNHGMKAGVAINPHTPVESIKEVLYLCDLVCLMSVNPGFGGQSFIENTYAKVKTLKAMINEAGTNTLIEIDGGVALNNAKLLTDAGADVLVAGNTVFGSANPTQTIAELKQLIK